MQTNKHMLAIIEVIEKALFEIGFEKVTIRLATKTNSGQEDLVCYQYHDMHCLISFCSNRTISGTLKDWVLIEYASNREEAAKWMFDDGDMIPLDLPTEQIVNELKDEVLKEINS